jgi:hypothetical protein
MKRGKSVTKRAAGEPSAKRVNKSIVGSSKTTAKVVKSAAKRVAKVTNTIKVKASSRPSKPKADSSQNPAVSAGTVKQGSRKSSIGKGSVDGGCCGRREGDEVGRRNENDESNAENDDHLHCS